MNHRTLGVSLVFIGSLWRCALVVTGHITEQLAKNAYDVALASKTAAYLQAGKELHSYPSFQPPQAPGSFDSGVALALLVAGLIFIVLSLLPAKHSLTKD
jgi:hypothetical protein